MGDNKMLELPAGDPSALGFIPGRLNKISSMIDTEVDAGRLPGAATIVLRQGKVVHSHVSGKLDVERPASISTDTLFRLWSQTKPMTAVVLLALFEDGEFLLDEPVSKLRARVFSILRPPRRKCGATTSRPSLHDEKSRFLIFSP